MHPTSKKRLVPAIVVFLIIVLCFLAFFFRSSIATLLHTGTSPSTTSALNQSLSDFNKGDFSAAISSLDSALAKDPKNTDLLLLKASTLAQEGSLQFKEAEYGNQAIAVAQQVLVIDPQNSEAWRIIGYAYEIMQNYPAAHNAYQKSLALNPKNALTLSQEAHAY